MKQMKRLLALMFMVCTFATFLALPAMADGESGTAKLTINDVKDGDTFRVWRIVNITFDEASNALTYEFSSAAKDYFGSVTIEDFMANYASNSSELNTLLAGLPQNIHDNYGGSDPRFPKGGTQKWDSPWGGTQTASGNKIEIKNCTAGGYFIEPISSTSVYSPMFAAIIPSVDANTHTYTYNDQTITAKHSDVTVEKKVRKYGSNSFTDSVTASSVSIDPQPLRSRVEFEVIIAKPKYLTGANHTTMRIVDELPVGLRLVTNDDSIHVYALAEHSSPATESNLLNTSHYRLNATSTKLEIDFTEEYFQLPPCAYLLVTYMADVTDDATIAVKTDGIHAATVNRADYTYSCYPYVVGDIGETEKTISDTASVLTYGLTIDKYAVNNDNSSDYSTKLLNAKFKLYRRAEQTDDSSALETLEGQDGNFVQIAKYLDINTTEDGSFSIPRLQDGTYYLVETAAPSGYKLDKQAKEVDVSSDTDTGYSTAHIGNSKANLALPTTGSTGMVIFTIIGIAVMGAAVVVLVLSSKKKKI